jgi:hypothetical protein
MIEDIDHFDAMVPDLPHPERFRFIDTVAGIVSRDEPDYDVDQLQGALLSGEVEW